MIKVLNKLKKEIITLILVKAIFDYVLTLFEVYDISFFPGDVPILNTLMMMIIPLIFFKVLSKENEQDNTLKNFILIGLIITILSDFIRVFLLNKYLLKIIYSYSSIEVIETWSLFDRTMEFTKFAVIESIIFCVIGIFKYLKR
ncbi:hypothetical protein [uncultured Psychroserpens sp.]|uniref:hypothetical protein n=1 Tax=uncultured Psychroserpens sp. TaxID=255436 RepID=UPI002629B399|nr:hypothetical protein [uncultured Psychroserpens sp.]